MFKLFSESDRIGGAMVRKLSILCFLSLASLGRPALACKCISSLSPCNQAGSSDVVFIGTVEAMDPVFLNRWNLSSRLSMASLNEAYLDARQHPSDASVDRLKNAYRTAFPDVAADRGTACRAPGRQPAWRPSSIPGWAAGCTSGSA